MKSGVTGGTVSYENGIKADADYAPAKKVRVELTFTVDEGDDAALVLDHVSQMAANKVHELLTGQPVVAVRPPAEGATEQTTTTRKRRTQAEIAADKAAAEAAASIGGETSQNSSGGAAQTSADDAASIGDDPSPAAGQTSTAGQAEPDAGSAADPWAVGGDEAKEVTDDDLNDAVTTKNGQLNDPPKIRELIAGFNPDPSKKFTLREIPQAQRGSFLEKLKALK